MYISWYLNFSGYILYKMWQSMLETAKNNPFGNPFHVAYCESSSDKNLVPGRSILAAAATTEKGG